MDTTTHPSPQDRRQQLAGSPRAATKGRESSTLCRNITIWGYCRNALTNNCDFNHDQNGKSSAAQPDFLRMRPASSSSSKTLLNVDSPSFTPTTQSSLARKSTFSSTAASATPFTPRGDSATPTTVQQNIEPTTQFNPATITEFAPQNYDLGQVNHHASGGGAQDGLLYGDPFTSMGSMSQAFPYNPYTNDHGSLAGSGPAYYNQQSAYVAASAPMMPPNYHLYQPSGTYRPPDLQPWQRATYDFFVPAPFREDMQKKAFATQQVMPGLPHLDQWHSLFSLDTSNRKNSTSFGYPSWMYKAQSNKNGRHFALRRLEGFRLTNEKAILTVLKDWKKICNGNIVSVSEAFTTRAFGDSSLIFVYDYHPLSKTLQEHYFPQQQNNPAGSGRYRNTALAEQILWSYVCQLANALKAIHSHSLAARCLSLSKIILTDKNRIRLAACSILDVVQFETNRRPLAELQQEDLERFGRIILSIATNTPALQLNNPVAALDSLGNKYSQTFRDAVRWLLTPSESINDPKTIDTFISGISASMTTLVDLTLQENDEVKAIAGRELENGRVARLLMKLACITERGDIIPGTITNTPTSASWSETGDRYQLKLFRDYVFHQVDADGKPRLAMGYMLQCMGKLDAGVEEMVVLTSRDSETVFVATYRELRLMLDRAFNELVKLSKHGAPGSSN